MVVGRWLEANSAFRRSRRGRSRTIVFLILVVRQLHLDDVVVVVAVDESGGVVHVPVHHDLRARRVGGALTRLAAVLWVDQLRL